MKGLLLVAHGSRRSASNDEVRALTRLLRLKESSYTQVESAFLELAEPSIPDGLISMIESGVEDITVLPYFLSAGRHVSEDIPAEIKVAQDKYPNARIRVAPYLGASSSVVDILLELATV